MKQRKVVEINDNGFRFKVIRDYTKQFNQYKVFRVWYDNGLHQKKLIEYGDLLSAMYWITDEMRGYRDK